MRTTIAVLLAVATAFAAVASANEAHPDCEAGQPNKADGAPFVICEGEQWDGQDPVNGAGHTGVDVQSNAVTVAYHADSSPDEPSLLDPHSVRVSVGTNGAVYYSQGQYGVGQQAAYVDPASGTVAWYGKDNTNQIVNPVSGAPVFEPVIAAVNDDADEGGAEGNLLAYAVGIAHVNVPDGDEDPSNDQEIGLAGFKTGEGDCTQSQYQTSDCERDNTAATVELVP